MSRSFAAVVALLSMLAVAGSGQARDLEDELERDWAGAWVVVGVESGSDCSGFYTNNEVHEGRTAVSARHRFTEGELARVEKVNLKSDRIDLYLKVDEPILVPRQDGPFTLFDERSCKVQLMVELPRFVVKSGDAAAVNQLLFSVVERHDTLTSAQTSTAWNRRIRDPLPADYEETLARHAAWQAEQFNASLVEVRRRAIDDATRILDRSRDDRDYMAGFAAGIAALRDWRPGSCSSLPTTRFSSAEEKPSGSGRRDPNQSSRGWKDGFHDGQLLAWSLAMLREVEECFVPVPAFP